MEEEEEEGGWMRGVACRKEQSGNLRLEVCRKCVGREEME
jgi:hypothetical protein